MKYTRLMWGVWTGVIFLAVCIDILTRRGSIALCCATCWSFSLFLFQGETDEFAEESGVRVGVAGDTPCRRALSSEAARWHPGWIYDPARVQIMGLPLSPPCTEVQPGPAEPRLKARHRWTPLQSRLQSAGSSRGPSWRPRGLGPGLRHLGPALWRTCDTVLSTLHPMMLQQAGELTNTTAAGKRACPPSIVAAQGQRRRRWHCAATTPAQRLLPSRRHAAKVALPESSGKMRQSEKRRSLRLASSEDLSSEELARTNKDLLRTPR